MNPRFDICRAWNGSSQNLDKRRTYHDTMSVMDSAERGRKCSRQDEEVVGVLEALTEGAASDIQRMLPSYPICSIRRSLNTLMNNGRILRTCRRSGN